MRKLLASAALTALAVPTMALAESSDTLTINLSGELEAICTAEFEEAASSIGSTGGVAGTVEVEGDTATATFAFNVENANEPTADATIGRISSVTGTFVVDVFCNNDFTLNMASANGAMVHSGDDGLENTAAFADELEYELQVSGLFGVVGAPELDTAEGTELDVNANETDADVIFSLSAEQGALPLISGTYEDTITLTFTHDSIGEIAEAIVEE